MMTAIVLALIAVNSPVQGLYTFVHHTPIHIGIGPFELSKPLVFWINEGLMVLFFVAVGLELKKEFLEGHLSSLRSAAFPAFAALGGMVVPAFIYVLINQGDALALKGWAIPMATDIVLALGVLSFLGRRVPAGLKVFLTALAIFDDIGAVLVVGLFYGESLNLTPLLLAGVAGLALLVLNRLRVLLVIPYVAAGTFLWISLLNSGIEASLAGVLIGVVIPYRIDGKPDYCPIDEVERRLKPWASLFVVPLFAFFNSGISFAEVTPAVFSSTVTTGIFLGLFLGKQLGVFGGAWLAVRAGLAAMPHGINLSHVYGVSMISGVGFTMSLFITSLAFREAEILAGAKLAILVASAAAAVIGLLLLYLSTDRSRIPDVEERTPR